MQNDMDKLIEYVTVLNNYEHGNYKLNDDEVKMLQMMNKSSDLKTQIEIDKINKMSFSERDKYIESLNEKIEQQTKVASSVEEEISLTFGVNSSNIRVSRLQDGKQLYTFFDNKLGRNVVLQDDGTKSLMAKLDEIRKESAEDADIEKKDMLEEERLKNNLEVNFILISELDHHLSEISNMNEEKRRALKCLLDHAVEAGISSIDLENVVGLDSNGNILEVHVDEVTNEQQINNVDNNQVQYSNDKRKEFSIEESEIKKDAQLSQMLDYNNQIQQKEQELLNQSSQKLENSTSNRVLKIQIPE